VLGLAACNLQELRTQAAQGTQIIESQLGEPKTFNYALNNSSPNVFGYIYEGLITEDPITNKVEPALAESWQISDDKKQIIFTLRDGLKWSDGQPLTVDDVVFSYQDIYLNPEIPTDIQDTLKIGQQARFPTVRKLDDRRVEFTTPEPFAPFVRSTGLAILPAHVLRDAVKTKGPDGRPRFMSLWGTDTNPQKIVGNGPYTLDSYVTSQRVVFRRNPLYWRKDALGQPQPYVERLVWQLVENRDTTLVKFRSGEADVMEPLRPEDFPLLKAEAKRGNFQVFVGGPRPVTTFIAFNLNQGRRNGKPVVDPIKSRWFNNVAFRQAVAYAIDRPKMNTNAYRGLGVEINSPIITQSPYYLSPEEGLKVYNYDPEKAKQLLVQSGFRYDEQEQLLDDQGQPVQFTIMTNAENTLRVAMIAQIKQDLDRIGIKANLNPINFNTLLDKLDNTYDWECYLLAMGGGLEPHWGSSVWQPDGRSHTFNQHPQEGKEPLAGQVVSDWEAEIGQLYIQGALELDETKRKAIYGKTQQLSQENLPWIPLVVERIIAVGRNKISGIRYPDSGGILWNVHELQVIR
jgi:peptide/nickel transport system substrate-binding protein